jgi:hypothetical protein
MCWKVFSRAFRAAAIVVVVVAFAAGLEAFSLSGGGGGISSVTHDTTLTGSGVAASPLGLVTPIAAANLGLPTCADSGGQHLNFTGSAITCGTSGPAVATTAFMQSPECYSPANITVAANATYVAMILVDHLVSFTKMAYSVSPTSGTENADFGLYNAAGNLIADVGAQHFSSSNLNQKTPVQTTPITMTPGYYYVAFTSTGTVTGLAGCGNGTNASGWNFFLSTNLVASTGGALPSSITPQTPVVSFGSTIKFALY